MKRAFIQFRLLLAGYFVGWSLDLGGEHHSNEVLQCYHKLFIAMRDQP